ncbi:MAG: hypothetical protein SVO26_02910 [Chloroflexota bacterium]|nr:hypothetical protein [Chloroflexota bacterium]
MTLRGKAAIVGIGELKPTKKPPPGVTAWGLMAEAARLAIEDAGLTREDIDGIILEPSMADRMSFTAPTQLAEYLGITVSYGATVGK